MLGLRLDVLNRVRLLQWNMPFLTPLRGWSIFLLTAHGLRRGLYSFAPSELARTRFLASFGTFFNSQFGILICNL